PPAAPRPCRRRNGSPPSPPHARRSRSTSPSPPYGRAWAGFLPFYGADCPAAVVWRASWPDERVLRGTLGTLAPLVRAEGLERTALILVGRALGAGEGLGESALYSAGYDRRFRPRA